MEADNRPQATIMIPTCGRHRVLVLLLASLHRSGHWPDGDIELMIVNNNPQQSTESAAVATLAAEYGAVLIAGAGPKSQSLNAAATLATGELLVFLDDDTTVTDPRWLKELVGQFDDGVGYVAGDVQARQTSTRPQQIWEEKGGLSKGKYARHLKPPTGRHTNHAWRLKRVAAGANCAMRRAVFTEIGGFCEQLGAGTAIEGGETLEIVDRVLRAGYVARYTPASRVLHEHPASARGLRARLRGYARGDSGMALHLAMTQQDALAAAWALGGHQIYRATNLLRALVGAYPLPPRCALASLIGSVEGVYLYLTGRYSTAASRPERVA